MHRNTGGQGRRTIDVSECAGPERPGHVLVRPEDLRLTTANDSRNAVVVAVEYFALRRPGSPAALLTSRSYVARSLSACSSDDKES